MKLKLPALALISVILLLASLFQYRENIALKRELLIKEAETQEIKLSQAVEPQTAPAPPTEDPAPVSSAEDPSELFKKIKALERKVKRSEKESAKLDKKLSEILRPLEQDMVSSYLETSVKEDELILTGGHPLESGKRYYASLKPKRIILDDGREAIRVDSRLFSLDDAVAEQSELHSLMTNAKNTLQHGEIWNEDDFQNTFEDFGESLNSISQPSLIVMPGSTAQMSIGSQGAGGHRMHVTPSVSEDDGSIDLEVRIEQQNRPNPKK